MTLTPARFALLTLAAFRTTRLVGWDSLTESVRVAACGIDDKGTADPTRVVRPKLGEFLHCPWCQGFWQSAAWSLAYRRWPRGTLAAAVPLALSAAVGLVAKNFDE